MPVYNFGEQILRAIQLQDELKQRNKKLLLEQQRFNANIGLQQRQLDLNERKTESAINMNDARIKDMAIDNTLQFNKNIQDRYMPDSAIPDNELKKLNENDFITGEQFDSVFGTPGGKYVLKSTYNNLRNEEIDRTNRIKANAVMRNSEANLIRANIDKTVQKTKVQKEKDYANFSSKAVGDLEGLNILVANKSNYEDKVYSTAFENYRKNIKTNVDRSLKTIGIGLDSPLAYKENGIVKRKPFWEFIRDTNKPDDGRETPEEARQRMFNNINYLYDNGTVDEKTRNMIKTYIQAVTINE